MGRTMDKAILFGAILVIIVGLVRIWMAITQTAEYTNIDRIGDIVIGFIFIIIGSIGAVKLNKIISS